MGLNQGGVVSASGEAGHHVLRMRITRMAEYQVFHRILRRNK